MKMLMAVLLLALVYSCSNESAPPPSSGPRPKISIKDSSLMHNEPSNPYVAIDLSPMDMSYLPVDYPIQEMSKKTSKPPVARVIYSRPHKQGRKIFGSLLKFGEPWRLGANEATEVEFFQPITIQDKSIKKGRYILYCIPDSTQWTIVFNSNLDTWGLTPDVSKDLQRFVVPARVKNMSVEYFSMVFEPTPTGADLVMAWDDVEARLPIQFSVK
jgi:hypothetical protein